MPHQSTLRDLARRALRSSASITDAASAYWSSIRTNPDLPDQPYPEQFRRTAFSVWGEESSSQGTSTRTRRRR